MIIEDYDSEHEVTTPAELEAALWKRREGGINSFWLSHGVDEHPKLAILVKNDIANVHYFPKERHAGFHTSVGNLPHLSRGGITNFYHDPGGEPFDILNEAVVPFSEALKVAQEFAVSKEMPKCIPWRSLVLGE